MNTISIKYSGVPMWLQEGELYRNLNADDPKDFIDIPANCFAEDDDRTDGDVNEFCQLIRATLFWVLDEIPVGVLKFCIQQDIEVWQKAISEVACVKESKMFDRLLKVQQQEDKVPFDIILRTGNLELIHLAASQMHNKIQATSVAAAEGALPALRMLHEQGFRWDEQTCKTAATMGHLDCLQYAHENGCPWNREIHKVAAEKGHLHIMQYAYKHGLCDWFVDVCIFAARNGHLECLRFAHEHGCLWPWDAILYKWAASNGHLNCMQYAHQHGYKQWHVDVCMYAAINGHLLCLQFAHENGCPWDSMAVRGAAQQGQLDCLRFLLMQGCPMHEEACNMACQKGHLECLQLLHEYNAPWNASPAHHAISPENVSCLQFLHTHGCPWDASTPNEAALEGNTSSLRYALEHGCPHEDWLLEYAVYGGCVDCLRIVVEEQILQLDETTFSAALLRGNFACVKYLLDMGCPYLDASFTNEADYDKVFVQDNPEFTQCMRYAVERGWKVEGAFCNYISTRDAECTAYLKSEGLWISEDDAQVV